MPAMEITSKERAYLRSLAVELDTIFQIGKGGIEAESIRTVDNALEARELIKLRVLETSPYTAREAADILSEELSCDVVAVVGTRFVLYRKSQKKPKIELPK